MENKLQSLNPIAVEASASSAVLRTESGTDARQKHCLSFPNPGTIQKQKSL
ncbi:hypothetical protein [Pedobacter sp. CFBP9032]|uniref:hypothetical protein n=1 Tax=Pedobacter sp. CFBP9032 TaxID=3096539 RepID=UPI002A6B4E4D|nr:hypothetical protein [Pedobacter sp. CFBP9032]MDY0904330.1 hypothetical protein [Pedobacter sp. CFBP9032]